MWTRLKAVMHPDSIGRTSKRDPVTREAIALAAALQRLGMDAEAIGEVLAVPALFNSTNALADGYQIEPDVLPALD